MSDHIDNAIRVSITSDRMTATLRVAAGTDAADVNAMTIGSHAHARGLLGSDALEQAIAQAAQRYDPNAAADFEHVLARGTPVKHGEDGRFELDDAIVEILDRAAKLKRRRPAEHDAADQPPDAIEGGGSHYQRSTIAAVKPGDRIGRIVKPTAGEDGIDVCGKCVAARHGAPASVFVDQNTIRKHDDGTLTAIVGGLLDTANDGLRINQDLVIHGDVDFSTGNIEFEGDIIIERGVRDCFVVQSARSVKVVGQVEAATICSGRDTILHRGMTGREKGSIAAGRDVRAKFIDSTRITVGRDLHVDREITHCTINVGRNIVAPAAAILGGACTVAGAAEFAQVGSGSNTETVIRLGSLPSVDRLLREAMELYPVIQRRGTDAKQRLEQLKSNTAKLTASQAESMTELQFLIMHAESKLKPLRQSVEGAIGLIHTATTCSLTVHKRLLPGVEIALGGRIARISQDIPGPIRIELDDQGTPIVTDLTSGSRAPLKHRAAMDIDDHRLDFEDLKVQFGFAA